MLRNRTLMVIGVALLLVGWLAWKVLHTASVLPPAAPAAPAAP